MTFKWFRKLVFSLLRAQFLSIMAAFISIPAYVVFNADIFKIIIGIISIGILLALTYEYSSQSGWSDNNRVVLKQIEYLPLKGLYASALLSVVWLVLPFINLYIKSNIINYVTIGFNFHLIGFYMLFGLKNIFSTFVITLIGNLIWIAVSFAAYIIGYKRISIGNKIIYKKPKNK